mmetsp:Transcript_1512/g.4760  ORF Transcript_1512/g.4760 Transcript_1512/m.4760 type:complete len:396 (+) Transcript_1512:180-1367(+)
MEFSKSTLQKTREEVAILANELKEDFKELKEEIKEDFTKAMGSDDDDEDSDDDNLDDDDSEGTRQRKREEREEKKKKLKEQGMLYDSDEEDEDEDYSDDDLVLVQESLEKAGEKIEQFGRNAAKFTGNLFSQVKETIKQAQVESDRQRLKNALARSGVGVASSSSSKNTDNPNARNANSKNKNNGASKELSEKEIKEQEFLKGVSSIQRDSGTYCEAPEDDDVLFQEFNKNWTLENAREDIDAVLKEAPFMRELRGRIVPLIVDEDDFWRRYFFAVQTLRTKIYPPAAPPPPPLPPLPPSPPPVPPVSPPPAPAAKKKEEDVSKPASKTTTATTTGKDSRGSHRPSLQSQLGVTTRRVARPRGALLHRRSRLGRCDRRRGERHHQHLLHRQSFRL